MENNQTQVIVARKWLWVLSLTSGIFLLSLIFVNLYESAQAKNTLKNQNKQEVHQLATNADVGWFERAENDYSSKETIHTPLKAIPRKTIFISECINAKSTAAMQAPINSNQITIADDPGSSQKINEYKPLLENTLKLSQQTFPQSALKNEFSSTRVIKPKSPYILQAGSVIPIVLITGINSDLPGIITAQVAVNVYDSLNGSSILIPQGSKAIGFYNVAISYGQKRLFVSWNRILFPNGESMRLLEVPGGDQSGYSGLHDSVDNHYQKIFTSTILMSVLSAGAQLSQPQNNNFPYNSPTIGQTLAQSLGNNLMNTANTLTEKNINIQPTLEIRPGYTCNIILTDDLVFSHPYRINGTLKSQSEWTFNQS